MAAIVELTVDRTEFALGRALREMSVELERIIPTDDTRIPFFWASGGDTESFERHVRTSTYVENLEPLETAGDRRLYRVEWTGEYDDLLGGIIEHDGTILQARTVEDQWVFRLRFPAEGDVTGFYGFCVERDIDVGVEKVHRSIDDAEREVGSDLTAEQRKALVLAYERGYFETPKEVSLEELTDELSISPQSLSKRIRRGNETILGKVLPSTNASN